MVTLLSLQVANWSEPFTLHLQFPEHEHELESELPKE